MPTAPVTAANSGAITVGGDLRVHRLGFGAMRLTGRGIWGEPSDPRGAVRVLQRCIELGVTFIDTADSYGPEVSERLIAQALHPYPAGLVIATKGGLVRPGPDVWNRCAKPEHLRSACEGSLRRLKVDRIDVYQLHAPDPQVRLESSLEELVRLQDAGKIRHIGLSNVSPEELRRAQKITPIVSVQNRYNLDEHQSDAVLAACEREGIAFIPWAPLGWGRHVDASSGGEALARVAARRGATTGQVALAWLLQRSPIMLPIPGTASLAHLEENIAAAGVQLTPEDMQELL
ncbi:MAG TPA: aldo/keto reductase [Steroidobacteraceae bacterium]|nr:aldo/keto reductase [Steroidobacteraceae bacterium]